MDEIQISKTYNIGFWWNSICYYLEVVCKPWHLVTFTSPSSEPHGWCLSSATFGRQPPSSWNCSSHLQYEYPFSAWHFWQPQDSYATTRQLIALGIWFYIISFKYKNQIYIQCKHVIFQKLKLSTFALYWQRSIIHPSISIPSIPECAGLWTVTGTCLTIH